MNIRAVPAEDWDLSNLNDGNRRERLSRGTSAGELIVQLVTAASQAMQNNQIVLEWQQATDKEAPPNTFRVVTQIPVDEAFFDELFNGRSGYRAQYYLSPEEGEAFNRRVIEVLEPVVATVDLAALGVSRALIRGSLLGPYSKIWAFDEQAAFDAATPGMLMPARWRSNGAGRGTRLPLASCVDVKGTFIQPDGQYWVDELKLDRAMDLHLKGYT
jgi:hypothetical protein